MDVMGMIPLGFERCSTPTGAYANCLAASERYRRLAVVAGRHVETLRFAGSVSEPAGSGRWPWMVPGLLAHWVCLEEGMVTDWTARQFDSAADFPLRMPLDEYAARWMEMKTWTCPMCLDVVPDEHLEWAPEAMELMHAEMAALGSAVFPDPRHTVGELLDISPCRCAEAY